MLRGDEKMMLRGRRGGRLLEKWGFLKDGGWGLGFEGRRWVDRDGGWVEVVGGWRWWVGGDGGWVEVVGGWR